MSPRIILVDDDKLLLEVIGDYLSSCGYQVDRAEDGVQALSLFEPGKYQLALIDQGMNKIPGLKLMHEFLSQDTGIFCLIMTGYPNLNRVFSHLVEGKSDYIIKPFQLLELLNTIQKHI